MSIKRLYPLLSRLGISLLGCLVICVLEVFFTGAAYARGTTPQPTPEPSPSTLSSPTLTNHIGSTSTAPNSNNATPDVSPSGTQIPTDLSSKEPTLMALVITWSANLPDQSIGGPPGSSYHQAQFYCTGSFVSSKGDVLTAGHCIDPEEGRKGILQDVLMSRISGAGSNRMPGGPQKLPTLADIPQPTLLIQAVQSFDVPEAPLAGHAYRAYPVDQTPFSSRDLALIKIDGLRVPTPFSQIAMTSPQTGEAVTAAGFRGTDLSAQVEPDKPPVENFNLNGSPIKNTPAPGQAGQDLANARFTASFKAGTFSVDRANPLGVGDGQISAALSPGMSGGPTYNNRGEIVGTNSYITDPQAFNYITGTDGLRNFLARNMIIASTAPIVSSPPPPADSNGWINPLLYLCMGLIGAVIGAGISYLVFRRYFEKHLAAEHRAPEAEHFTEVN